MIQPTGLVLDAGSRVCGICSQFRRMSRTHVPPQAAGNSRRVERALLVSGEAGLRPGRWRVGGMWIYGLCADCNRYAGTHYDLAYAAFANRLSGWLASRLRLPDRAAQAISFAPGRVSRSIVSGMLGISPHIRVLHPELASQMYEGGPVRLPGGLALRVAIYLGTDAQLTGPMLSGLTDGSQRAVNTLAAVTFQPLTWALVTTDEGDLLGEEGWADATDWLRFENDAESVDLRALHPRGLPIANRILHAPGSDELMQLFSSDIATIMVGRIPLA